MFQDTLEKKKKKLLPNLRGKRRKASMIRSYRSTKPVEISFAMSIHHVYLQVAQLVATSCCDFAKSPFC